MGRRKRPEDAGPVKAASSCRGCRRASRAAFSPVPDIPHTRPSRYVLGIDRLRQALAPGIVVERELASGGMGIVFVGRDVDLDRPIAIKVLRPELATAIAAERFLREGRAAAQLSDAHVVRVHHAGIADGLMYFTMDLVGGETLASRLLLGPLSADETAAMGRDILEALAAAHRQHLIHRDVKPSNVFLDDSGAKLGDFGIARVLDPDTPTLTHSGQLIGTLAYMAPEQLRGEPATQRTDIYAVGMVLFEACMGRRWATLADPDGVDWAEVPRGFRRPLRKALQLEPKERWPDARSFAAALPGGRMEWRPLAVGGLVVAALAYLALAAAREPASHRAGGRAALSDMVVFPFETVGLADTVGGAGAHQLDPVVLRAPARCDDAADQGGRPGVDRLAASAGASPGGPHPPPAAAAMGCGAWCARAGRGWKSRSAW